MKKRIIATFLLGFALFGSLIGATQHFEDNAIVVKAEGEEQQAESYVTIAPYENGEVSIDKEEGKIGDIVTVTIKHDLFYLVSSVTVNDIALIESETTNDVYSFSLVEGENLLKVVFVIDQELLGDLSVIYEQAKNKDWANLFSVDNILRIISWILEGGILIAIIRYFIKDKKLEEKVEKATKETIEKIIPEKTKEAVTDVVTDIVTPMVQSSRNESAQTRQCMSIMVECIALMQENTPEAKLAILQNLKKISEYETNTLKDVEEFIKTFMEKSEKNYQETMNSIEKIVAKNKEVLEVEEKDDDKVF